MNLKKTIKTLAISLFLAVAPNHASAQDLIARQAPVDRKMAAVDTIMPVSYTHLRAHET